MAIEHAIFKFDDLKVTSHYDRQTDRMTTKVLSSRPRIKCGETNKHKQGRVGLQAISVTPRPQPYTAVICRSMMQDSMLQRVMTWNRGI